MQLTQIFSAIIASGFLLTATAAPTYLDTREPSDLEVRAPKYDKNHPSDIGKQEAKDAHYNQAAQRNRQQIAQDPQRAVRPGTRPNPPTPPPRRGGGAGGYTADYPGSP